MGSIDDRDRGGSGVAVAAEFDALLDSLAHPHRRKVLRALLDRESSTTLLALTWEVAARRDDTVRVTVPRPVLDRIQTRLHHVHLPKLAAAGVVDYDTDHRAIELTADPDRLERILDDVSRD